MKKAYPLIVEFLWLALVATLPITSFPLVAKIVHTSSVAPASLVFLGLLVLFWLPVYLYKNGRFPFQFKIVVIFLFFSLVSTFLSFFYFLPAYKNNGLLSAVVEGMATLAVGILFYLITVIAPNTEQKIQKTLKVINWSGVVMIIWSLAYLLAARFAPDKISAIFHEIQFFITTSRLYVDRAIGLTSEPSWLAHILNIVYLPYWLSATFTRYTAHNKRFFKLSFENLLLAGGGLTLLATLSRAGIFAFLLVIAFLFIRFNIRMIKLISSKWYGSHFRIWLNILLILAVILIYTLLVFGMILLLSKIDPRMAEVFSIDIIRQGGLVKYADALKFGERVTYWQAGWNIFNRYPIFGVGLGNAGFFFQKMLPDNAWQLTEVRRLVYHSAGLMNIKSMWVRTLAETGIVGFSIFVVFLLVTGVTAGQLISSDSKMKKAIGWMGIFMLITFIIEGFSVDSYALPYLWFTAGLVAATWRWTIP